MVWTALTFINKLPRPVGIPVVVKVVRVSGTIRKAEEDVIRRAKLIVRRAKAAESSSVHHMMEGVVKAMDKRRETETTVLAQVDPGSESEGE
jgi:ribonuclease P/MRP protein subunit POP5